MDIGAKFVELGLSPSNRYKFCVFASPSAFRQKTQKSLTGRFWTGFKQLKFRTQIKKVFEAAA